MTTTIAPAETTTYGVFFGANTFPSATFPTFTAAERYLLDSGVAGWVKARTDLVTTGIVMPERITPGEWATVRVPPAA